MIAYICIFLINAFLLLGSQSSLFTPNDPDWIPSLNLGHRKVRTNGEKAKQGYSRNLTRSLNKSHKETTKQHKKVCQPKDLQTDKDFVIERSLFENADFPLSSPLLTKIYLETVAVLTSKLKVHSKKIAIKLA